MNIKEIPTNTKVYYRLMKEEYSKRLKDNIILKNKFIDKLNNRYKEVKEVEDVYFKHFKINLQKYKEFVDNTYYDGKFYKVAKGLFINRNNNYELVTDLFNLYDLARLQKEIYCINKDNKLYEKLINLTLKEYTEILKIYYTEVHKQLILNGYGYAFENNIGWICINRIILKNPRPKIDYAATKKREKELIEQGKRIWNKEEAEWCSKNGIEYKAEDKRVFKHDEYCYEIPLLNSKLPNGTKLKLELSDYRHSSTRGKTNDQLIEECNFDTNKICELPVGLKTKLTMSDKVDKILYTKFIRNENQESATFTKTNSKDR